jgi:hypothetical protein
MSAQHAISLLHIGKLVMPNRQSLCLVRALAPRHATVRASLPVSRGANVTLGLRHGMTIAARVESAQRERIMLSFPQPLAMERLMAEQARGRCGPESVRLAAQGAASVETGGRTIIASLRDISLFGLQLDDPAGALLPDTQVTVHIAGLARRAATVRWHRDGHSGLRFAFSLGYELLDQWLAEQDSAPSSPRFGAPE